MFHVRKVKIYSRKVDVVLVNSQYNSVDNDRIARGCQLSYATLTVCFWVLFCHLEEGGRFSHVYDL